MHRGHGGVYSQTAKAQPAKSLLDVLYDHLYALRDVFGQTGTTERPSPIRDPRRAFGLKKADRPPKKKLSQRDLKNYTFV